MHSNKKFILLFLLVLGIIPTGIGVGIWVYKTLLNNQENDIFNIFISISNEINEAFKKNIIVMQDDVTILTEYQTQKMPTYSEFVTMVNTIKSVKEYYQVKGWIPKIYDADRNFIEGQSNNIYNTSLVFRDLGQNGTMISSPAEFYFPIYYLYPIEGNENAIYFNMISSESRRNAIYKARDSGSLSITKPITLVQENDSQKSFIIFGPVYSGFPKTLEDRRQNFLGVSSAVIRLGDFILSVVKDFESKVSIGLYYEESLLHSISNHGKMWKRKNNFIKGEYLKENDLYINKLNMTLKITSLSDFGDNQKTNSPIIILITILTQSITLFLLSLTTLIIKRNQSKINIAKEESKINEIKQKFISFIFHEVRIPIHSIAMGIQTLLTDTSDIPENKIKILEIMNGAAKQVTHILNDVLDIQKIEEGKLNLNYESFQLSELIDTVNWSCSNEMAEKSLEYSCNIDESLKNISIVGDINRLKQCLDNFMSNAMKFTPSGGKISFDIIKLDSIDNLDTVNIRFSIVDSGVGIPEKDINNIFKPYIQIMNPIKKDGGTGLGLSITKQIINLHNGTVGVTSVENKGSNFYFDINFKRDNKKANISKSNELKIDNRLKGIFILVVEDSKTTRDIMGYMLDGMGIKYEFAIDGKKAVNLCINKGPIWDIILMDKTMPIMNGLEATKEIRKMNIKIPIIALTGNAFLSEQKAFEEAGANGFLTKPFVLELFQKELLKHI